MMGLLASDVKVDQGNTEKGIVWSCDTDPTMHFYANEEDEQHYVITSQLCSSCSLPISLNNQSQIPPNYK